MTLTRFVSKLRKRNESGRGGKVLTELSPKLRYLSVDGRAGGKVVICPS